MADDSAIPIDGNSMDELDGHTSIGCPIIRVPAVKVGHDEKPVLTMPMQLLRPNTKTLRGIMHVKVRCIAAEARQHLY